MVAFGFLKNSIARAYLCTRPSRTGSQARTFICGSYVGLSILTPLTSFREVRGKADGVRGENGTHTFAICWPVA